MKSLLPVLDRAYQQANEERPFRPKTISASSLGKQARRLALELSKGMEGCPPGEVLSARTLRTFEVGKDRHDRIRQMLAQAFPETAATIPTKQEGEVRYSEPLGFEDWIVAGHPDAVLNIDAMQVGDQQVAGPVLIEIKTINAFGWRDCLAGVVDFNYLCQAGWYAKMVGARSRVFVFEKKDTQHLHAIPMPATEPRLNEALAHARRAAQVVGSDLKTILDRTAPCSGDDYGWTTPKRGPVKLGWRCSYCPFVAVCFPTHVRMVESGKPVCVDQSIVPADAYVVAWGSEVIPRGSWKLAEQEESAE